jgi:hypothetical protein
VLTRTEILESLRKMGYDKPLELKRFCREYEAYLARVAAATLSASGPRKESGEKRISR